MNQDLLTKLLATENLLITRENVRTASFNIVTRNLRLPIRLNLSETEEFMMSIHEVGHALYTDKSYLDHCNGEQNRKHFHSYMNVLEDVRIERLMKDYYPGVRKDFFSGYKALNERDFFGVSNLNLKTLSLIDRINLYFKVGFKSGVTFNKEERIFLTRAERTSSIDDVYALAVDVYDYTVEKNKERDSMTGENDIDDYEFNAELEEEDTDEYEDGEADGDEDGEADGETDGEAATDDYLNGTSGGQSNNSNNDSASESITQRNFDNSMELHTEDPNKNICYVIPGVSGITIETPVEEVIEEINSALADALPDYVHNRFNNPTSESKWEKFRTNNNKSVSHLVKEFEIRKAARRYSRTQVSSSGALNMRKIHSYRTSGDIFAKMESILDEKDHSFLMLLDWSGSMSNHFSDSVGQVITLASFCRRVKIPFKVVAFREPSLSLSDQKGENLPPTHKSHKFDGINGVSSVNNVELVTLLDSSMNSKDFDLVTKFMYTGYLTCINRFDLTSTPLIQALSWTYNYLPKFQKEVATEKTTLIVVTDGEANRATIVDKDKFRISMYDRSVNCFIRCKYTGRIYSYSTQSASEQMNTIMNMINNAFPSVSRVGFFITSLRRKSIDNFNRIYGWNIHNATILNDMRKNNFCEYPTKMYDKLFVIPSSVTSMEVDFGDINGKMTPSQISRKMSSAINGTINSRVVLTKFVETIA